jgi:hypothetical protein
LRELYVRYWWQDKVKKVEFGATPKHQEASQYTSMSGGEKNASAIQPQLLTRRMAQNLAQNGAER